MLQEISHTSKNAAQKDFDKVLITKLHFVILSPSGLFNLNQNQQDSKWKKQLDRRPA